MTFGEKLKELRRARGISQEELAERLNVSRQAVSKWELDLSLPDIDNIVQLSEMFHVSTDHLLKEQPAAPDSTEDIAAASAAAPDSAGQENGAAARSYRVFAITIGLMIIGLMFSLAVWFTWQTLITVMIGLAVQIIGVIIFEVLDSKNDETTRLQEHRRFYTFAPWLILPFPIKFSVDFLFHYYPSAHNSIIEMLVMVFAYLLICGVITYLLHRQPQTEE